MAVSQPCISQKFASGHKLTSFRLRFWWLKMGHRIFKAISLKALAIFKPRAILMPVVMVL
jgi:hypothetical protein